MLIFETLYFHSVRLGGNYSFHKSQFYIEYKVDRKRKWACLRFKEFAYKAFSYYIFIVVRKIYTSE